MKSVDIVIPTFNRHARLKRTLAALARQSAPDFGVIVVDDGSTPRVEPGLDRRDYPFPLTVLTTGRTGGGPAHARNLGVAASQADLIAFTDDDVDPAPDWLERHLAHHTSSLEPLVSFGPLLAPRDWRPTPWNWWEAATLACEYERMASSIYPPGWRQVFTGNAVMPRTSIVAVGGFNETFTRAEDIELALRLSHAGHRFVFAEDARGWHYADRTLASWLRIPRDYARFDVALDRMHPEMRWLSTIDGERRSRRRLARLARALLSGGLRTAAVRAALLAARACFAFGVRHPSIRALSLVYDLEYGAALAKARATPPALALAHELAPTPTR